MNIYFEKAAVQHIEIISSWLNEPHMMEYWDNSQAHKDDILNFIHGRKQNYFYGTTKYWIGYINNQAYSFLLSDTFEKNQNLTELHRQYLSSTGHTIGIDFGIGNPAYVGKGLAAITLKKFIYFYHQHIEPLADTFFIDPDINNIRAQHVYNKAGFNIIGQYEVQEGAFKTHTNCLMVKTL